MSRHLLVFLLTLFGLAAALSFDAPLGHADLRSIAAGGTLPALPGADDLYHWPRLPVRIFILTSPGQDEKFSRLATAGFDEWVRAAHGLVSYQLVASYSQAQIVVRFVPTSDIPDHPDLVGLTTTHWTGQVLQSAEIVLATGQKSSSDLQTAAAHEFGHALGIRDHSEDPNDLMFSAPIRDRTPTAHPVTGRDMDTLKRCYPTLFAS